MKTIRWLIVGSVGLLTLVVAQPAMAQVDRTIATKKGEQNFWLKKFKGSFAGLDVNLGTGTLVSGESDEPYISNTLTLYPRYNVAKAQSVRLYWALECEYAQGMEANRHCDPSDMRLSYHHNNLWSDPFLKGTFYGYAGLYFPTGYASQNNNTVTNVRLFGGYLVNFFKSKLEVGYSFAVQKYLPTSAARDTNVDQGSIGSADAANGSTGSGGRLNDNWLFINNFHLGYYFTPKLWVSLDLMLYNYVRRSAPEDFLTADNAIDTGRADSTWGVFEVGYKPLNWLVLGLGISSFQPALTADAKSVRFPFYDFISPEANYTKWYLSSKFIL